MLIYNWIWIGCRWLGSWSLVIWHQWSVGIISSHFVCCEILIKLWIFFFLNAVHLVCNIFPDDTAMQTSSKEMFHWRKYWKVHCIEDGELIPAGYAMYTKNMAFFAVLRFKLVVKLVNVYHKWFPWYVLLAVEAMICLANSLFNSHLWFHLEYM
jgi:hypothetical protein